MKKKILFAVSCLLLAQSFGCSNVPVVPERPYKVGVTGFQQCSPQLTLKEIGYLEIPIRNEANDCTRRGMPVIFAAELAKNIKDKISKEVVIVPLDVPYNYNIRSQIDIAKTMDVDYLIGGKIDKYVDPSAPQRAKYSGILPNTATLSPTPSKIADDESTDLVIDLKLARVLDGKIISEYKDEFIGKRSGYEYTKELAEKIAEEIIDNNK
ncbi:MAG: hypothetical protein PHN84_08250 [Desulfuromonadaceae bacterium]|nr:hypothetical protein [Desulfuromonadaceae bacterium]MDD2856317.1 hypothetical protein [Desulfuromonadaceae bacterium]